MKMNQYKHLYLTKPGVELRCKKCSTRYKVSGNMYVVDNKTTEAVDGTQANFVIWICGNGHIRKAGWTKPVDFSKTLPEVKMPAMDLDLDDDDSSM